MASLHHIHLVSLRRALPTHKSTAAIETTKGAPLPTQAIWLHEDAVSRSSRLQSSDPERQNGTGERERGSFRSVHLRLAGPSTEYALVYKGGPGVASQGLACWLEVFRFLAFQVRRPVIFRILEASGRDGCKGRVGVSYLESQSQATLCLRLSNPLSQVQCCPLLGVRRFCAKPEQRKVPKRRIYRTTSQMGIAKDLVGVR